MAYVYEKDYALMELLLNVIIDRIYDMPSKEVQEDYFLVLDDGIGGYSAVYDLIEKYKDHEDAYVREVVEEYFYDLRMEEEGQYK